MSRVHVYLTFPFVLSWSLVEAMATGCVIVASDTGPVREAIEHERNGLLTPFLDPAALAGKVLAVLADPAAHAALGKAARATALARYDRRACLDRTLELLGASAEKNPKDVADRPSKRPNNFPMRKRALAAKVFANGINRIRTRAKN